MGTCGQVDRALDLRSEGLGSDSHCLQCGEVSGKLFIPYWLCPPRGNGYLVERKIGKLLMALNSPQIRQDRTREFQYQGCKLQSLLNSWGFQPINIYIYILHLHLPKY